MNQYSEHATYTSYILKWNETTENASKLQWIGSLLNWVGNFPTQKRHKRQIFIYKILRLIDKQLFRVNLRNAIKRSQFISLSDPTFLNIKFIRDFIGFSGKKFLSSAKVSPELDVILFNFNILMILITQQRLWDDSMISM